MTTAATCRLPSCRETIIDWLDRHYCSVDHRNRAVRAKATIALTAAEQRTLDKLLPQA